jgi:hypothetical protein
MQKGAIMTEPMAGVATTLIGKLDGWYVELLIPCLIAVGIWLVMHLRRDKQGKLYFYRESYEKKKTQNKLDAIIESVRCVQLDVCKNNIYTVKMPIGERMASAIRYVRSGGNGETRKYIEAEIKPQNPELYAELEKLIGK